MFLFYAFVVFRRGDGRALGRGYFRVGFCCYTFAGILFFIIFSLNFRVGFYRLDFFRSLFLRLFGRGSFSGYKVIG